MIVRTPTLADLRRFVEVHAGRDGATPVMLVHSTEAQSYGVCAYGLAETKEPWPYPSLILHEMASPFPIEESVPDADWIAKLPVNGFKTRLP